LLTQKTTHLIAERPEGEKYIQAKKFARIEIVTPEWLEMCAKKQILLSPNEYRLVDQDGSNIMNNSNSNVAKSRKGQTAAAADGFTGSSSLEAAMKELLSEGKVPPNPLFSSCSFFLVGFPLDDRTNTNAEESGMEQGSPLKVKKYLCLLIRRGMGTVFWDVNRHISHVVVSEHCDMKTRYVSFVDCCSTR